LSNPVKATRLEPTDDDLTIEEIES